MSLADDSVEGIGVSNTEVKLDAVWGNELAEASTIAALLAVSRDDVSEEFLSSKKSGC
jgi:hypothetical protein